jgi:hypothetical protein
MKHITLILAITLLTLGCTIPGIDKEISGLDVLCKNQVEGTCRLNPDCIWTENECIKQSDRTLKSTSSTRVLTTSTTLFIPELDTLSIASWNLQRFGPSKAGNEDLMKDYVKIMGEYDIIVVQEITGTTVEG